MDRFDGKVAIVTGGASGIGEATVRRLLREGATVVIADIRSDAIDAVIGALGPDRVHGMVVDMMDMGAAEALVEDVAARFGGLDILVNNAGMGSFGRVTDIDLAHWRDVMT
ncbi:MAG: SDR family NAD(P)-dependent oxidoreductase, partial [Pseudomonadota bacterium]